MGALSRSAGSVIGRTCTRVPHASVPSPQEPPSRLCLPDALLALLLRNIVLVTHPLPQGGELLAGGAGPGMLRPKHPLADGKRPLVERESFLAMSLLLPQ